MKKISLLLIGLLITFSLYSQHNLRIDYTQNSSSGAVDVTNNTMIVGSNPTMNELTLPIGISDNITVWNISPNSLDVKVIKEIIDTVPTTQNYFCWDLCFGANVYESGIINLPSAIGTTAFSSHYLPNNKVGTTKIRYWFVSGVDSVYLEIWFDIYSGIDELSNGFKVYPNPTTDYVYFDKQYENIKIYSIYGVKLDELNDIQKIDLSLYESGIYMLMINNKTTIKIIKK